MTTEELKAKNREWTRAWRKKKMADPEWVAEQRAYHRAYRAADPAKVREYNRAYRARKRADPAWVARERAKRNCAYRQRRDGLNSPAA